MALRRLHSIAFESSSDEDDISVHRPRWIRERSQHFEDFDDIDFETRFRLSKQSAHYVLQEIEDKLEFLSDRNNSLSPMNQLLCALRFYATGSDQLSAADFSGFSKSTAHRIIHRVSAAIASLYKTHIVFPEKKKEILETQAGFYKIASFPKVIGAIDCSHVKIKSPGYPQGHFEQSTSVAPPNAPMTGQPVIPLPPAPQPSSYAPPPPFLVPPPQFMPPQTAPPNILNYVPGPNGPQFQPNYQGYQGYTPAPVQAQGPPPPQELFQPQGCTYYSPAQQQQQQQPVRRPTAAIPILPPPDNQQQYQSARNRSKITLQHPQQETHPQVLQKHHDLQQQEHLQQLEFEKIKFHQTTERSEQEQHNIVAQQEQPIQYELQKKLFEIEQTAAKNENLVPQEQELRITQEKELRQYEEVIEESQDIVEQENLGEIPSSLENKIIDDKLLSSEKSLTLPLKEYRDNETFQNVNVQTKEIETVAEVHECSVEITEKHPTVSTTVELISEAPVKLNNAPVVDTIVSSSTDNTVVENGETDGAVLEKPVVNETAA